MAIAAALVALLVGLVVAGCGSSDSSSSSSSTGESTTAETTNSGSTETASTGGSAGLKEAEEIVAKYEQPIKSWDGFEEPFKPETGKKIVAVECIASGGCKKMAEGVTEAGEVLGWSTSSVDGKANPALWNSAIQNAVASGADGIYLLAVSPALVQDAVERAEAAGVKVVSVLNHPAADGFVGHVIEPEGEMNGSFIAADSGGKTHVLMMNDPSEFPDLQPIFEIAKKRLEKSCDGECPTSEIPFTFNSLTTKGPAQVAAALQQDPEIGYVMTPFDAAVPFVQQGIEQAGSDAKIVSAEGLEEELKAIGQGTVVADAAPPSTWIAWAATDMMARLFDGQEPPEKELPLRLFTEKNMSDIPGWEGDVDFRAKYEEAWGK